MKKLIAMISLGCILSAGISVVALLPAEPASADVTGCTVYARQTVGGISIPNGSYCATIVGTGTTVRYVSGTPITNRICNWDISAEFFNRNWVWKKTYRSSRTTGCNSGAPTKTIVVNRTIRQLTGTSQGYMCSTLRVGGQRVTSVCNYVY